MKETQKKNPFIDFNRLSDLIDIQKPVDLSGSEQLKKSKQIQTFKKKLQRNKICK
ncbi:hypothetical protein IMG5_127940 [Ichthyophthirius multifiliis]|uniref:Uncharacterized protein n=1 Tax=Ichthyophthirius multifiliis TaxID=5932 RepID=G0QVZ7_ICHMU|nr:hypothetical protein IMG5_127940 [Ichthyophthirius multifiliis]EGR30613.1 hypothetical protein IMG5_127940 [Ichthyophthirius multifiliis]|eukprot:XP_004032200.1 hypothetical protein IMG5_127940 [Ichthyophthirius multifiliis]